MQERTRTTLLFILGVASLLTLVGWMLALHDIARDYASPMVLQSYTAIAPSDLPAWTTCPGEWDWIRAGLLPLILFHVAALVFIFRQIINGAGNSQEPNRETHP